MKVSKFDKVSKFEKEKGISLVETLVALLLLSLGLTAALMLHFQSQRVLMQAEWLTLADNVALSLHEIYKIQGRQTKSEINVDYWKQTLENRFPGSVLALHCDNNHCSFTMTPPKTMISLPILTNSFH